MNETSNNRAPASSRKIVARLMALLVVLSTLLAIQIGDPAAFVPAASVAPTDSASVCEVVPRSLPLGAPLDRDDIEISGLAWHGDTLVVLPQYPSRAVPEGTRRLYGLPRAALAQAVADSTAPPITPIPIALLADGMTASSKMYQGFEAIAFAGPRVYLLMENARDDASMEGVLFHGTATPDLQRVSLQTAGAQSLPMQAALRNMSYEALIMHADTVLALFEANGARVNPRPRAYRYDAALRPVGSVPFPTLEYRLTDATSMDTAGRFWITNYFYPGEEDVLKPTTDSLAVHFGQGNTHRTLEVVERLVEYQYAPSGIRRTETPPVQLALSETGRNWEGVARFDDGFLLATDRYPSTLLAYVPHPPAVGSCDADAP